MIIRRIGLTGMLLALLLGATSTRADSGFALGQTRVVITQEQGSTSVMAYSGPDSVPYLVKGAVSKQQNKIVPDPAFAVSPPLSRLEPGGRNTIRIRLLNAAGLPTDRESVFYLHMVGIPGRTTPIISPNKDAPGQEQQNTSNLSIGLGHIIKLFYRPNGIGTPGNDVYRQLSFSRVSGGVQVKNPSPYNITLDSLRIGGKPVKFSATQPTMLPPFSQQVYSVNSTGKQVDWSVITDDGLDKSFQGTIQ